jgi:dihydroorotate dehydrogenase (NAD+) catalytic subunit
LAGASAIQVGTANFVNPGVSEEIVDGISSYVKKHRLDSIRALIGALDV